ncbi:hypothetical protein UF75_4119 [Desulfosporosinus sp. I2]|nr:hypothetical protein UF75_4119 [Desulfosporosinus sp. I2]
MKQHVDSIKAIALIEALIGIVLATVLSMSLLNNVERENSFIL